MADISVVSRHLALLRDAGTYYGTPADAGTAERVAGQLAGKIWSAKFRARQGNARNKAWSPLSAGSLMVTARLRMLVYAGL
jgi:hypothetical protein